MKTNGFLIAGIVVLSLVATLTGILSDGGPGPYAYTSIRGQEVMIYGRGIYQHMSAEVAPQGIAQDYVTLFLGIPLLLLSFFKARKGSLQWLYVLSGTLGYFLVTYLFYTAMGMYNVLFLVYAALLALSFFAFLQSLLSFDVEQLPSRFKPETPVKLAGIFLIINTLGIAFLWLSVVVPPLLDGSIYPAGLHHYTTLIVQGFDLGLLLPLAFVSGLLFIKRKPLGYLAAPVYLVFLSILMTALVAKIIAIMMGGEPAGPAIVIIPVFLSFAVIAGVLSLRNIRA
ncbi:MAG: hypothetical protein V2I46_12390 [Bacteroides sp.]|jgi:hypothetical protein|nr:hypothetical protein [Bacteroides sp.]